MGATWWEVFSMPVLLGPEGTNLVAQGHGPGNSHRTYASSPSHPVSAIVILEVQKP